MDKELFFGWPDVSYLFRVSLRLLLAAGLGGIIGWQRERTRKPAGIRTHVLVALGAALFTLVPLESGMTTADLSRVIQGLTTGIGFLGAGVILKQNEEHQVRGLTTAAGVWVTAGVGLAIGAGWLWPALCGAILAWGTLQLLYPLENWVRASKPDDVPSADSGREEETR